LHQEMLKIHPTQWAQFCQAIFFYSLLYSILGYKNKPKIGFFQVMVKKTVFLA